MLSNYIKELLTKNKMTQKELAQILGIKSSAVNQWKTTEQIKPCHLYDLSKLFSVSIDDLLQERFVGETISEKCHRLYGLEKFNLSEIINRGDTQKFFEFSEKIRRINKDLFELLYLKMTGKIEEEEQEKLEYIKKYIKIQTANSPLFKEGIRESFSGEETDLDIAKQIEKFIDIKQKEDFIWEIQKIYSCQKKITKEDFVRLYNNIEQEDQQTQNVILESGENIYLSYSQKEKDEIVQSCYKNLFGEDVFRKLFLLGGNLIYQQRDFEEIEFYSVKTLDDFEGTPKALFELDEIKQLVKKARGDINQLNYQEYKKIINHKKMIRVSGKEKNPIKRWESFKQEQY